MAAFLYILQSQTSGKSRARSPAFPNDRFGLE